MTTETFKRKLTAILSADVEGYSRLMGEDEEATVRTLTSYREIMSTLISQHRGRVVDSPGDNLLAEFASVTDAVRCAVEIQEELKTRNAELPENRKMLFRIGINIGDVIQEGERIYGDGVNIAARIESLGEGGDICISGTVYEHIKKKLTFRNEYLGEHAVKNISEPVRVYRVRIEPEAADSRVSKEDKDKLPETQPPSLPEKPSIAVLPFSNMSGDPEQEYFSDGMTEDVTTDLSKISGLFVIARNSTFTYKGKSVKVKEVGRELGVRYVLEGSVRKAGDRVRITAQLIDVDTEGHLWAERYDRDLKDVFSLQDEVTQKIVAALSVRLTEEEQERLVYKETDNLEAYDYILRGLEYCHRITKEANAQARQMFEKAIELDTKYALAYSWLGRSYWLDWVMGWNQDPQTLERAYDLAQRAIALDDSQPSGHSLLGEVYLWKKQLEQAIAELEKTIALNPNDADGLAALGNILSWAGRSGEAIGLVKKAIRLNPVPPVYYLWNLGHAFFLTGQYEKAIQKFKQALKRLPDYLPAHAYLAVIYSELGRHEEARVEASEVGRLSPQSSLESWRERLPYKNQGILERMVEGLSKAGLK
jgi:TolB-like protein